MKITSQKAWVNQIRANAQSESVGPAEQSVQAAPQVEALAKSLAADLGPYYSWQGIAKRINNATAAPAMLEALKKLVEGWGHPNGARERRDMVLAAINLAEGRNE